MESFSSDISQITQKGDELITRQYSDIALLHESGNGAFCLFRASRFGKKFILKALKPQFRNDPFYEAILQKEFMIGDSLKHQGIVSTIDYITLPETGNCIVLEYINGITLRQYLAQKRPLPITEARFIITSICEIVGYLHSTKTIHRDLKPENIMIEQHTGVVKIIDLGCADTSEYDIIKGPAGTRLYAAPEQLNIDSSIDTRVDIFAIGKIMLDIIESTGKSNKRLTRIATRCSAPNPKNRYSSTNEIISLVNKKSHAITSVYIAIVVLGIIISGIIYWTTSQSLSSTTSDSIVDTSIVNDTINHSKALTNVLEQPSESSISKDTLKTGHLNTRIIKQPLLDTAQSKPKRTEETNNQFDEYTLREKADSIFMSHAKYIERFAEQKISSTYANLVVLNKVDQIKSLRLSLDDVFVGRQKTQISDNVYLITSKYTEDVRTELMQFVSSFDADVYIMRLEQIFDSFHTKFRNSINYQHLYQPYENEE